LKITSREVQSGKDKRAKNKFSHQHSNSNNKNKFESDILFIYLKGGIFSHSTIRQKKKNDI
jgi:hypothetical protein